MTPILVRPVREQLEHDRVIRLLQARWRRKYVVTINQGSETVAPIPHGDSLIYPDVVLASTARGHRIEIVVEVETGESVNNLEALAEWARMAQLSAAFHLYVPAGSVESARRLCVDHSIPVAEIWSYHPVGDQTRFAMAYKAPPQTRAAARAAAKVARAGRASRTPAVQPARTPAPAKGPVRPPAKPTAAGLKPKPKPKSKATSKPKVTSKSEATSKPKAPAKSGRAQKRR